MTKNIWGGCFDLRVAVHSAVLGVVEGRLDAQTTEISLTAAVVVEALRASNEATLGIPEGRLPIVACGAGDIGTATNVHVDFVVYGVATPWGDEHPVAGHKGDKTGGKNEELQMRKTVRCTRVL